ncbi:MAG TPA: glycosyltransferase, partial [Draconibacterium sp.]|nr:glycosyltransferase [Draconibacterium sp.]
QADELKIKYEIRVYDDGSANEIKLQNRQIAAKSNVVYVELEKNLGRSAVRNKMGFESKFQNLLFIDADSLPVEKNYLKKYIENLKPGQVLCGGTVYNRQKPVDQEKYLRWVYGTNREAISAENRNSKKGFIITSNNFLIEKPVFEEVHFREDIKNYGHEDTLLGYDLFRAGIEIFHIDNPLEHTGLEDSSVFISKTKTALESLCLIEKQLLAGDKVFVRQVNFLNRYYKITQFLPPFFLRLFYKFGHSFIRRNLEGINPNLFLFDLYKLGFYSTLK